MSLVEFYQTAPSIAVIHFFLIAGLLYHLFSNYLAGVIEKLDTEQLRDDLRFVAVNSWPLYIYIITGLAGVALTRINGLPLMFLGVFEGSWEVFMISGSIGLVGLGVLFLVYLIPIILKEVGQKAVRRYSVAVKSKNGDESFQ